MKTPRTPEEIRRQREEARTREINELRYGMSRKSNQRRRSGIGQENTWLNRHIATNTGTDHDRHQGFHFRDPKSGDGTAGRLAFSKIPVSSKVAKPRTIAAANHVLAQIAAR